MESKHELGIFNRHPIPFTAGHIRLELFNFNVTHGPILTNINNTFDGDFLIEAHELASCVNPLTREAVHRFVRVESYLAFAMYCTATRLKDIVVKAVKSSHMYK